MMRDKFDYRALMPNFSLGLLYLVLKHIVDRYNLVFNYRSPAYSYIDTSVHETAVMFAVISSYLLLFSILFYSFLRVGKSFSYHITYLRDF